MDPTQPSHGADAPAATAYLPRPEGRIAYDLAGEDGPLVVCMPGMGELRSSYRISDRRSSGPAIRSPPWTYAATATATPPSPPTTTSRPAPMPSP